MGLPPARLETNEKNHFLKKEFTNFGWSLQVAILRRGALQMGLPLARQEISQKNHFSYKEFSNFGWSLQLAILSPFLASRKPSGVSQKALP